MTMLIQPDHPLLSRLNASESDRNRVLACIEATSAAMEKACRRTFALAQYDETYTAGLDGSVILHNNPVDCIERVYDSLVEGLQVANTTATNASFSTTATALSLTATSSGVTSSQSFTYSSYPTITQLVAAIVAYGHGWTAEVEGDFGPYATADLVAKQFATCKSLTGVSMWADGSRHFVASDQGILLEEFGRGQRVRIVYRGGYDPIPDDLQAVCAAVVGDLFADKRGEVASLSLGEYSYSLSQAATATLANYSTILARYKERRA